MTAATNTGGRERLQLDDAQRNALAQELFAHWEVLYPGPGMDCFCGDDQDLVDAVQRARAQRQKQAQQQAQRRQDQQGDDEAEL